MFVLKQGQKNCKSGVVAAFECLLLLMCCMQLACSSTDPQRKGRDCLPQKLASHSSRILVDLYHTRKQNHEDYQLQKDIYSYQGVFGYHRAFQALKKTGYDVESTRSRSFDTICLFNYSMIFLNLLHSDRPDFSKQEKKDLLEYIAQGGGMFVIADHTNVYHHAERLNPLLKQMGIEVMYNTVVEQSPHQIDGSGWIKVTSFKKHPVTEGLRMISLQTGGSFKTDAGVAFSSKLSFSDHWDPNDKEGFYGDWTFNGDRKKEPKGPLAVVAAKSWKKGRVTIVGDQNIFGDTWLHLGDNFRLFLNAVSWTSRRAEGLISSDNIPFDGLRLYLDGSHQSFRVGVSGWEGYYSFFSHCNRDPKVQAEVPSTLSNIERFDVLWFADPKTRFKAFEISLLKKHLKAGKTLILSFEADQVSAAQALLLKEFAPKISFKSKGKTFLITKEIPLPAQIGWVEPSSFYLVSDPLKTEKKTLISLRAQSPQEQYLLDISSSWGKPLVEVSNGTRQISIARYRMIGKGKLIVFFQDGFWRSRSLGRRATDAPKYHSKGTINLLYDLLTYLRQ